MQNSLIRLIILFVSSFFIYRYRYRVMNMILENPWIRRTGVSMAMQLPYIRERMMRQMF